MNTARRKREHSYNLCIIVPLFKHILGKNKRIFHSIQFTRIQQQKYIDTKKHYIFLRGIVIFVYSFNCSFNFLIYPFFLEEEGRVLKFMYCCTVNLLFKHFSGKNKRIFDYIQFTRI